MSTLKVTNIQATGETATRAVSGIAAAWVNYTPASATVLDSINVSTLTDNGVGDTSVNYTSSMVSANYTQVCGAVNSASVSTANVIGRTRSSDFKLAGSTRLSVGYSTPTALFTLFDYQEASTVIHGDLA